MVDERDVYSLPGDQRKTVVDTVVAEHAAFPMVLVSGAVVTHDDIDLDAVVKAAREALCDDACC